MKGLKIRFMYIGLAVASYLFMICTAFEIPSLSLPTHPDPSSYTCTIHLKQLTNQIGTYDIFAKFLESNNPAHHSSQFLWTLWLWNSTETVKPSIFVQEQCSLSVIVESSWKTWNEAWIDSRQNHHLLQNNKHRTHSYLKNTSYAFRPAAFSTAIFITRDCFTSMEPMPLFLFPNKIYLHRVANNCEDTEPNHNVFPEKVIS
jgi:hypothetical protein